MRSSAKRNRAVLACYLGMVLLACTATPVHARRLSAVAIQIRDMRRDLDAQRGLIAAQAKRLAEQQQDIDRLRTQIAAGGSTSETRMADAPRAASVAQATLPPAPTRSAPLPTQPVGETPQLARVEQQVEAVPQGQGVLTRAGHFVLEPSLEYTNSSNNRLVYRGTEYVPGIQIGQIEASDANRDTLVATTGVRYGLSDSLELEASVPYLYRSDRVTTVQQRNDTTTQQTSLNTHNIGDMEFGLRYQLNRPVGEQPIFVGSLRVKTDTGKSPYAVPFDETGVATGLATGSGFWAVQPGLSFLLPSDPAVIFGGVTYLYQVPKTIDRAIGKVLVGKVKPGGAIGGNLGFGFALNPRFSFSLGYRHTYIFPTRSELNGVSSRSSPLQVGAFTFGMSYRLTEQQTFDLGVEVGATKDAPDLSLVLRAPFTSR